MRELGCELDGALVSVVSLVALTGHSAPSTAQPLHSCAHHMRRWGQFVPAQLCSCYCPSESGLTALQRDVLEET